MFILFRNLLLNKWWYPSQTIWMLLKMTWLSNVLNVKVCDVLYYVFYLKYRPKPAGVLYSTAYGYISPYRPENCYINNVMLCCVVMSWSFVLFILECILYYLFSNVLLFFLSLLCLLCYFMLYFITIYDVICVKLCYVMVSCCCVML